MTDAAASSPAGAASRCAYLISLYPARTHTFIVREVRGLRASGVGVQTVSIRRAGAEDVLSPIDEEELRSTHALLPASATTVLRSHAGALARSPWAYIQTLTGALRLGLRAPRALLWQLFYFVEAVMLWAWLEPRGIRHVHAHFSNVASDVAMLVARFGNAASRGDSAHDGRWTWSLTVHGPTEFGEVSAHRLPAKVAAADAVLCVSDFARSQLMALAPSGQWGKLYTMRLGVDVSSFRPDARRSEPDALRVLTVAAMSARKGHVVLLAAVSMLRERGVALRLVLVGDGPEYGAVQDEVERRGLQDDVTLAGAIGQHEIVDYYRAADAFCLPSFAEGLPVVLMEAMAMGLPVVATQIAGVPELVEDGRSGLLVAPGSPDALADALESLAADPALRESLGTAARERVAEHYDIDRSIEGVRSVLLPLLEGPGAEGSASKSPD